ncbi:metallophosphoesterase family protein [Feifania hominis]|uniref:Metallophosphoesterase n=1 Tax=Feifania hominis TaxID=2763660 RepID=A0A926HUZ3_9FIRM|nr:metallophosphoesterase [Feifania hominis]MBC8536076.1 metallophosphoesterase [Feifania hominis]
MLRIIQAADFHLDSALVGLPPELARARRSEMRARAAQLIDYAAESGAQIALLPGDLFDDGTQVSGATVRLLGDAFERASRVRFFIAPGNHDPLTRDSVYRAADFPKNVHIFSSREMTGVPIEELGVTVWGIGSFDAAASHRPLAGFQARGETPLHIGVVHGNVTGSKADDYAPMTPDEIAHSGLAYLALGHVHSFGGVQTAGEVRYAYSGALEGRGFDETGEKGFLEGTVERGRCELRFVPFARRRYEIVPVRLCDVRTTEQAALAVREALDSCSREDILRVVLEGEIPGELLLSRELIENSLRDFYHVELRDHTRPRADFGALAQENSLRGLFVRQMMEKLSMAADESERALTQRALRIGLRVLEGERVTPDEID